MKKGTLLIISAPSGAGKSTICKLFLQKRKDFFPSVSATTRQPRAGETDGKDYFFLTKEQFLKEARENGFLETAEHFGNFYGTPKKFVLDELCKGHNLVLEIDVVGAFQVKDIYPECKMAFITAPSFEELERRLKNRNTETDEVINIRLEKAKKEMEVKDRFDIIIVNDDLNSAVEKLVNFVEN